MAGRFPQLGICLPGGIAPRDAAELGRLAEAAGFDAVWVLDVRREPYLTAAAVIGATSRVEVGTNVAVAFSRSPAATAAAAWDLALWSGGRFILGLGSQVKGTLEARFGVSAPHPAPMLKDYVAAVRACFAAYRRGKGGYHGEYYQITRAVFQPGSDQLDQDPPIHLAGVNPVMIRTAGECADGFAAHPFCTVPYLEEVIRPALREGAGRAGREPPGVHWQLVVAENRGQAATQMTAYAVPAYRRVMDQAGLGEVADAIFRAAEARDRSEVRRLIDAELIDRLGIVFGDELEAGVERFQAHADRVTLSVPWFGLDDREQLRAVRRLIESAGRLR